MTPYSVFWMLAALVAGGLLVRRSQRSLGLNSHEKLGIAARGCSAGR